MDKEQILNQKQLLLLKKIGENDFLKSVFYLTGGTALAAFYLGHRYSEDLDFFSEKEIDILPISAFFESIKKEFKIIKIDFQQSFNRNLFFLDYGGDEIIKLEFTHYPFPRIEPGWEKMGINIDSLFDIAVNKLFTIYQRSQIKDYIDLYFICREKGWVISDLVKKMRIKFDWHIDPLQLGTQFVKVSELGDLPNMIKKIKLAEVQNFFIEEAKKLKEKIIK